jgi:hypothetical protein
LDGKLASDANLDGKLAESANLEEASASAGASPAEPGGRSMADRPLYRLTLRPLPGDVPPAIRLRAVLKRLLRSYGFRAVRVEEVRPNADRQPAAAAERAVGP